MNRSQLYINGECITSFMRRHDLTEWEEDARRFLTEWFNSEEYITAHTSGSTSAPKPIRLLKQDMIASADITNRFFKLQPGAVLFLPLSANYIAGKMMLVRAILCGGSLILQRPSSMPQLPENRIIDLAAMIPMQVETIIEKRPETLENVTSVLIGGAPISGILEQKLYAWNNKFYATYGMTETVSHVALRPVMPDTPYCALGSIRFACDKRNCLSIQIPHLSIQSLQTNDIVELLSPITFYWRGRYDHVINSGGIKLFPEQIERKLETVIRKRFYILGEEDTRLGERVVLYIEDIPWNKQAQEELHRQFALSLLPYEIPKQIYFRMPFKETSSGKVKRIRL